MRDEGNWISSWLYTLFYLSPLFARCNNKKHFGLSLVKKKNARNQEQCNSSTGQLDNSIPRPTFIVFHDNTAPLSRRQHWAQLRHEKCAALWTTQCKKRHGIVPARDISRHEHVPLTDKQIFGECDESGAAVTRAEPEQRSNARLAFLMKRGNSSHGGCWQLPPALALLWQSYTTKQSIISVRQQPSFCRHHFQKHKDNGSDKLSNYKTDRVAACKTLGNAKRCDASL